MSHPSCRLLVITELYLPTKGGTAVWFDEVYRRLGGKDVHVVTADVPGSAEHDRDHPNSVHRVSLARHWWLRPESAAMYAKLLARAIRIGLRHRIDAVHAGRVLPEGFVGLLTARLLRVPLVVYAHGEEITTWRQPAKLRFMTFTYRQADRVVANSEFTRNELLKLGVAADRITLIYPGVDVERFRPGLACEDLRPSIGIGAEQKLILSVGRLSRRKGFDEVIRSLPRLVGDGLDTHLALIGIGEDRRYLESVAAECGVAQRVHFLGHVSPEDLPRWYAAADVFAMPNREINGDNEGFGMVFIEASACGRPAIAGRDGGTGDAVLDGVTGYRVNGHDSDAVVAGIRSILADPQAAQRMGADGLARVREEFSWQRVADKTMALADVLSRQGSS